MFSERPEPGLQLPFRLSEIVDCVAVFIVVIVAAAADAAAPFDDDQWL